MQKTIGLENIPNAIVLDLYDLSLKDTYESVVVNLDSHYSYNTSIQTLKKWILSPIKGFGSFKRILGNSPELGYAVRYNCDYKDFDLKWLGGAEFEMT